MIMQFPKQSAARRLSVHLWVICGSRVITPRRQTSLCVVVAVCRGIFQTKQKNSQMHLNYKVLFFPVVCYSLAPRGFSMPPFWHLCPPECNSRPSSQRTRKLALQPACQLLALGPTDSGGMDWLVEANGSRPPPRAENGLECCLPQTQHAAPQNKRSKHRSSSLRFR